MSKLVDHVNSGKLLVREFSGFYPPMFTVNPERLGFCLEGTGDLWGILRRGIAQIGFEFPVLLPQPLKCRMTGFEPPHLAFWFFKTGFLCSFRACPGTRSCRSGWPPTHKDLPASASRVLGLKVYAITIWLNTWLAFVCVLKGAVSAE